MPIDFYCLPASSPCRSVLMLAKYLDLELNLKTLNLQKGEHLTPEFIQINPQHVIPTLVDDGFVLWESRAILSYLASKYGNNDSLYPTDVQKRAVVDRLLYFDIGTLYKSFADYMYPQLFKKLPGDPEKEQIMKKSFDFLNTFLEKSKYVAGDNLTIADLAVMASVSTIEAADFDLKNYPKVYKWSEMLKKEIPHYEETNQKGVDAMRDWYLSSKK